MKKLTVFLASSPSSNPLFINVINELAQLIAEEKLTLVYGGSTAGLMGTLANAVLAAGHQVIGVFPQNIPVTEIPHPSLTRMFKVNSIAERVIMMQQLGDAFMVLPGGLGTIEELFIVWNQIRLGVLKKPLGIVNAAQFYSGFLNFLHEDMRKANFITEPWLQIPHVAGDVKTVYAMMKTGQKH